MLNGTLGTVSNRATWTDGFELIDGQTDALMDLDTVAVSMKLAREPEGPAVLTGSTETGELTIPGLGLVAFRFEAEQMQALRAGTYCAVVRLDRGGDTDDIFLGTLAVAESF